jgi:hypothetical protein
MVVEEVSTVACKVIAATAHASSVSEAISLVSPVAHTPKRIVVPIERVLAPGSVVCTLHQIKEAKIHAGKYFPGAKVAPVITRSGGIDPPRAKFVADFLRDKTVVEPVEASFSKAASKIKWRLKERRWPLWKRLVKRMQTEGFKPVSWSYFWEQTGNGQYELQTAENCDNSCFPSRSSMTIRVFFRGRPWQRQFVFSFAVVHGLTRHADRFTNQMVLVIIASQLPTSIAGLSVLTISLKLERARTKRTGTQP